MSKMKRWGWSRHAIGVVGALAVVIGDVSRENETEGVTAVKHGVTVLRQEVAAIIRQGGKLVRNSDLPQD